MATTEGSAPLARLAAAVECRLGIDARALAAVRVGLALVVVADLLARARDLRAFYTDAGVLPRAAVVAGAPTHRLSVHLLSGEAWAQAALFVVAGLAALALALGYRTTSATLVSWALLVSLQNRNPLVLNGGDVLLRLLLLWAVFLPLGERWAVDARRRDREPRALVTGLAPAAFLLQVVAMYAVNAALKLSGELWLSGEAIRYVFDLDQFTVTLGDALAGSPALLVALDRVWLALVTGSVLLVALHGWPRAGYAGALAAGHLGMYLTMRLGLFPFVSLVGLVAFAPPVVWKRVEGRIDRLVDPVLDRADAALPVVDVAFPSDPEPWRSRLSTTVLVGLLVLAALSNAATLGLTGVPDPARPATQATRVDQHWNMFAPNPLRTDGWYVVDGRLANGSRVDPLHGGELSWERPDDLASAYPTSRWRKYLVRLQYGGHGRDRRYLARYLCRRWDATHDGRLVRLELYYVEEPTTLGGPDPRVPRSLGTYRCAARLPA